MHERRDNWEGREHTSTHHTCALRQTLMKVGFGGSPDEPWRSPVSEELAAQLLGVLAVGVDTRRLSGQGGMPQVAQRAVPEATPLLGHPEPVTEGHRLIIAWPSRPISEGPSDSSALCAVGQGLLHRNLRASSACSCFLPLLPQTWVPGTLLN